MILSKAFDVFAEGSPVCVMIRGSLEHALSEEFVNKLFEQTAERQYTRELLFSDVVDVMAEIVCQVFPSVNAAYTKQANRFKVSRRAVYDKINHIEPSVSRELVVQTASRIGEVAQGLRKRAGIKELLPGYPVRILDGNHLRASHHRIKELRDIASGPLPGQALVVLDPDQRLIVDLFPCEDAHAQERSQLIDVLDTMQGGEVWIADRNFCTSLFLFQTAANRAYFVTRQHATNVPWEGAGALRRVGRTDTGVVYEQRVTLTNKFEETLSVRRITVRLDHPTEDGEQEIHILTNLPKRIGAKRIAEIYRTRWRLEAAFGELASCLNCEIDALGYPPAALFAFSVGAIAYNILSLIRMALAAAHGPEWVDEISAYYLADEIRGMMRGMQVAIPDKHWQRQFGNLTNRQMMNLLIHLAKRVNLNSFRKNRRGPKKPITKRTRYKDTPHVATARILLQERAARSR
jgi:IS4 transposase